jgi:hypothetical protein
MPNIRKLFWELKKRVSHAEVGISTRRTFHRPDVVTLGEAMVALSPPSFQRLEQTSSLDIQVGGGELNVAVAVSRLGLSAAWISKLPENALGRLIRNKAREQGVDTSQVVWSKEGRAGLYFMEFGASPRASSVLYDRSFSAISQIKPGEVDWQQVFKGARWFPRKRYYSCFESLSRGITAEPESSQSSGGTDKL